MKRQEWIDKFVNELVLRLRKDLKLRTALPIAEIEWSKSKRLDPRDAAKAWASAAAEKEA